MEMADWTRINVKSRNEWRWLVSNVRLRLIIEVSAAVVSMGAFILTLIRRDWIEVLSGVNPDHHSGAIEGLILGVFLTVGVIAATLAGAEWRHMRSVRAGAA
jgi:hypothetical protein